MTLTLEEDKQTQSATVKVNGSVDTLTAPSLEDYLTQFYDEIKELILDFSEVSYISSAGLRVLLKADKAMERTGRFALKNVNPDVREVLDLTGFCEIVTILE